MRFLEFESGSPKETHDLAIKFAKKLKPGDLVALRGGFGVGKTAFVRGLCEGLGIKSDVSSPTYTLMHHYKSSGSAELYHFDMYRVSDEDSLESTGFYDYLEGDGILAVEWSESIPWAIPSQAITVEISIIYDDRRRIKISEVESL